MKGLLELINDFSKKKKSQDMRYQKSGTIQYAHNKLDGKEIKDAIPLATIAPNTGKYLGINWNKQVKNLKRPLKGGQSSQNHTFEEYF